MKNKKIKSLDGLETGIKQLLREDRCSFSEEEKVLLNECIELIQHVKKKEDIDLVIKILTILSKLLAAGDYLKDIF